MALTEYQRSILAPSWPAGGLRSRRVTSRRGGADCGNRLASPFSDIDLFHDTKEALLATWEEDRRILSEGGYRVEVRLQFPAFVEAFVRKDADAVVVQWAVDSAFRFFPLVRGPVDLPGLHPFDLPRTRPLRLSASWSHGTGWTSSPAMTGSSISGC